MEDQNPPPKPKPAKKPLVVAVITFIVWVLWLISLCIPWHQMHGEATTKLKDPNGVETLAAVATYDVSCYAGSQICIVEEISWTASAEDTSGIATLGCFLSKNCLRIETPWKLEGRGRAVYGAAFAFSVIGWLIWLVVLIVVFGRINHMKFLRPPFWGEKLDKWGTLTLAIVGGVCLFLSLVIFAGGVPGTTALPEKLFGDTFGGTDSEDSSTPAGTTTVATNWGPAGGWILMILLFPVIIIIIILLSPISLPSFSRPAKVIPERDRDRERERERDKDKNRDRDRDRDKQGSRRRSKRRVHSDSEGSEDSSKGKGRRRRRSRRRDDSSDSSSDSGSSSSSDGHSSSRKSKKDKLEESSRSAKGEQEQHRETRSGSLEVESV